MSVLRSVLSTGPQKDCVVVRSVLAVLRELWTIRANAVELPFFFLAHVNFKVDVCDEPVGRWRILLHAVSKEPG